MHEEYLKLTPLSKSSFNLYFENGAHLGTIERDVDGFYYYWPNDGGGCFSGWELKLISDLLNDMNKKWEEQIQNDPRI